MTFPSILYLRMANTSMADDCGAGGMSAGPSMGKKKSMGGFGKKGGMSGGAGKLGKSSKLAESMARLRSKGALA